MIKAPNHKKLRTRGNYMVKSIKARIERLEAVHEIQNLVGKYSYLHTAGMQEKTTELWAKKNPGYGSQYTKLGLL